MKEYSLITPDTITISQLATCLERSFECVRTRQNEESLQIEHLPPGFINELIVRDGSECVTILDKPSVWEVDYEGAERESILRVIASPKVFIMGGEDVALLERMISALDILTVSIVDDGFGNLRILDRRRREHVAEIAARLGFTLAGNWRGVGAVWPILERMRQNRAVVVIKLDGERTGPVDGGQYTVIVSGPPLAGAVIRRDSADLDDALAAVISQYASKVWGFAS